MAAVGRTVLAGSSVPIPAGSVTTVWDAVRRRIHAVVQECNCVAGEAIWGVTEERGNPARLRVWDRTNRSSSLELSLYVARALLCCEFRSPKKTGRWIFHIAGDTGTLRRSTTTYSVAVAVDTILDGLVCA